MKTSAKNIFAIATLSLIAGLLFFTLSSHSSRAAPAVKYTTLDGSTLTTEQLKGNTTLVTFWATSCPGCMKEMPHLIELHNEFNNAGLEIIGVAMSYDPPNHVAEAVKQHAVPYNIALDLDGSIAKAFDDVRLTPTSFLIDKQGNIIFKKLGEMNLDQLRTDIQAVI